VPKKLWAWGAGAILVCAAVAATVPLHGSRPRTPSRVVDAARAEGPLSVGAAEVALDVPAGAPVAGFPRLRWASLGVRDVPEARAVVFAEPGFAAAIVSVDILLVPPELRRAVEARLSDLKLDAVVVAATHTHSGPGGYWKDLLGQWFGTGPYDEQALSSLAGRIAEAVRGASAARTPARLSVARTRLTGVSVNRDTGEVDGRLLVFRATGLDERLISDVVVFPAHATIVDSKSRLISGDWPSALARELPGVTVVLQGAVGDQTWRLDPGSSPSPETYAGLLAAAVGRLAFPAGDCHPALGQATAEVALPDPSFAAVPRLLDRLVSNVLWNFMPARATVTALRLGPALLLAVPGAPTAEVGRRWREALGEDAEVVSLAGDYLGYVETPEQVLAQGGEARRTYLGPRLAEVLGDGLVGAARAAR
jgi:hypothetical protein